MEARLQVLPAAEVERVSEYAAWELAENREMSRNARKRAGRKGSFNTKTTRMSKIVGIAVGWSAALPLAKL
jgi:hypothetical protein